MSRKHEIFNYDYGIKLAPEQWSFYLNNKAIRLDNNTRSTLARLCIAGKVKEAEDVLKRLLRKEEKKVNDYICIGFFVKNSRRYYFSQDLKCHRNDLQSKLYAYKEWKRYIQKRNNTLQAATVTSGYITPDGISKGIKEDNGDLIDITRGCIIKLMENKDNLLFAM